jgi:crotonobetainyl-CoA:carnitine CoA-transferase CaiB-like acyl-CoA transferase
MTSQSELTRLLHLAKLPDSDHVEIRGRDPIMPSRFKVGEAAATALAACGVAANTVWTSSGGKHQYIEVDTAGAAVSLISFLCQRLDDGSEPQRDPNRPLVGFYQAKDGRWVHLHGAFPDLAAGTLSVLGCDASAESIRAAVSRWDGEALEDALSEAGMCGAMARTREEWLAHPQGEALRLVPPVSIKRIADSPIEPIAARARPLAGVRVLDLTRVLAGPTCARTLASHGANVLKVNSPNLPSVPPFVIDTGHGKRSTFLDLNDEKNHKQLKSLIFKSDIFSQGYRKGALAKRGLGPEQLAEQRPGIIYVSINAYGHVGPWAARPGWEQLAQTASGVAVDEGSLDSPRLIAAAATDYTTGYLGALGAMAALHRRSIEGGSYHVEVSLAQTANWLYEFGLFERDRALPNFDPAIAAPYMVSSETGFGRLHHLGPIIRMSETEPRWEQVSVPLGHHPATW